MWFVYRFTRNSATAPTQPIDPDIAAFSDAIVRRTGQPGRWVAATARAPDGGIEVWYNLAQLPSESPLREIWAEHLSSHALSGCRIANR